MSDTSTLILLVTVGICLILSSYPGTLDMFMNKKEHKRIEPQLPSYYTTGGVGEQLVIGCANGIVLQQGNQTIDMNTSNIRFCAGQTPNQEVIRITDTGKIGIGTTNPSSLLHVNGDMTISNSNINVNSGNFILGNGKIGIGTTDPVSSCHVHGSNVIITNGKLGIGTTIPLDTISLPINSTVNLGSVVTKLNTVSNKIDTQIYGNVGIGTAVPEQSLQICSDGNSLNDSSYPHTVSFKSSSGGSNPIEMFLDTDYVNQCSAIQSTKKGVGMLPLSLNPRGGNVGIGITNPSEALVVNGNIKSSMYYTQSASHTFTQATDNGKWFKIASFIGTTYGEFIIAWDGADEHGEVRFNASCSYNGWNVINITGSTLFNVLFDQLRISTDNSSIYNTNYIEVHTRAGTWGSSPPLSIYLLNVGPLSGGLTVLSTKTTGTATGYTYYPINTNCSYGSIVNSSSLFFNGNLGINTQNPTYTIDASTTASNGIVMRLNSNSSDACLDIVNTSSGGMPWRIGAAAGSGSGGGSGTLYVYGYGSSNAGIKMVITPSGWVGLGTTAPSSRLETFSNVAGDGAGNYITARNIATGETWTEMRLINDTGYGCHWFLNASNRSGDGGGNLATLRNDIGALRLSNANGQSSIMLNGSSCTVYGNTYFQSPVTINSDTYFHGKVVIQDSVNGGGSRGIWMWAAGDSAWGIYMATSGGGVALNGGTAPAGYGFSSHSIRFRVNSDGANGFIFENSNNNMVASIRASDGYSYFPTVVTNSVTANQVYTSDWFRINGGGGIHWDSYGKGIQCTDNGCATYGTVSTYGSGRSGWTGWAIGDLGCFMADGTTIGIHNNARGWVVRGDNSQVYLGSYANITVYNGLTVSGSLSTGAGGTIGGTTYCNGYLGVQTWPNYPLDVNGGIRTNDHVRLRTWYFTPSWDDTQLQFFSDWYGHMNSLLSSGSWWRGSDMKIKSDVKPLNVASSIKKIMGLRPVSYIHKNAPETDGQKQRTIGFIAQEVQKVNPYCVSEQTHSMEEFILDDNGEKIPILDKNGEPQKDKNGVVQYKKERVVKDKKLGICYEDLYIHAINVVKYHQTKLEHQDKAISELETATIMNQKMIENLSSRLTRLERMVVA